MSRHIFLGACDAFLKDMLGPLLASVRLAHVGLLDHFANARDLMHTQGWDLLVHSLLDARFNLA